MEGCSGFLCGSGAEVSAELALVGSGTELTARRGFTELAFVGWRGLLIR